MKFEHIETREDWAGTVIVTASTPEEKLHLLHHLSRDTPDELVAALSTQEPLTIELPSTGQNNAGWFLVEGSLDLEWTEPYRALLEARAGWDRGILPDIPEEFLTPRVPWCGLRHTYICKALSTQHGHLCYELIVHGQDWNGFSAQTRATHHATRVLQDDIGKTGHEEEYIHVGNRGLMKPNPRYPSRLPTRPAVEAKWFWEAIVDWWLAEHATPAQAELVVKSGELNFRNHRGVSDLHCRRSGSIRWDWENGLMSWEDFHKI